MKGNRPIMANREELTALFEKHGYTDFKWISPGEIVVAQWVRMKCTFGCSTYGKDSCCPPNTPSVSECRRFFDEYETAVVFHFAKSVDKPEDRKPWTAKVNRGLMKLERDVFLGGYHKAFLLPMDSCRLCADCTGVRSECKNPELARPGPEAMAVDVYATVRKYGYAIGVLPDYTCEMNRYAFLLIE